MIITRQKPVILMGVLALPEIRHVFGRPQGQLWVCYGSNRGNHWVVSSQEVDNSQGTVAANVLLNDFQLEKNVGKNGQQME